MKLFRRTLLSFAGVIVLEAGLASMAIATVVGSMQMDDAGREIRDEARGAFDSLNSWKLAFWKRINELAEDDDLRAAIAASRSSPADDRSVIVALRERLSYSGAGAVLLVDARRGLSRLLVFDPSEQQIPDNRRFVVRLPHPYIEVVSAPEGFWFSGEVRLAPDSPRPLDVFLLKRIDRRLVGQLSWDPMVLEAVTDGTRTVVGAVASTSSRREENALAATMANFLDYLGRFRRAGAWLSVPRLEGPSGGYGAISQVSGTAMAEEGERPFSLLIVLSLADYARRTARVNEAVLAASLLATLVTILLAFVLSRSIASPIRRLVGAMDRIGEGDYRISVKGPVTGEIGELLDGFHSMARKLENDRLELDARIAHEINNPLSSILSNVQNLIEEGVGDEDETEVLRLVERETRRIARIVRQLLSSSASAPGRVAEGADAIRCSPNEVARELVRLVGRPYRKEGRIRIELDADPDCPDAAIGEDELKQVLLNLVKNALRAVGGEGTVVVGTRRVPEGVLMSVSDSGGGIPDELLGRIFDPLFSAHREAGGRGRDREAAAGSSAPAGAKDLGDEGTGLGLSVVWGIATGRGGSVTAVNDDHAVEGRRGAVLRVVLPAAKEAV